MGIFRKEAGPPTRIPLEERLQKRSNDIERYRAGLHEAESERIRGEEENLHPSHQKDKPDVVEQEVIPKKPGSGGKEEKTCSSETRKSTPKKAGGKKERAAPDKGNNVTLDDLMGQQETGLTPQQRRENEDAVVERVRDRVKSKLGDRIKDEMERPEFRDEVYKEIEDALMNEGKYVPTIKDRKRISARIYDLIMGYGPLTQLFKQGYSEIMVSRYDKIFVEESGKMKLTNVKFGSERELCLIIEQMVARIGRTINASTPLVDGRLEDGSRFNAVLSPIAVDGAQLTIRRFPEKKLTEQDYLKFESLDENILWFLKQAVRSKWNLIVSGGTGSGKTSLLNLMSNFLDYDPGLSVVTIEDSCELRINHPNVRRYETKNANAAGAGEITARTLVKNLMRVRPDVAIIGEIRDGTMADFLRLNTSGHEGGMTTVHNNSPEELEGTMQILVKMAKDYDFSEETISRLYANAVDLIIQIKRYPDYKRRISHITHVVGYGEIGARRLGIPYDSPEYNPNRVYTRDIFVWKKTGIREDGTYEGTFAPTGYVPRALLEKSEMNGVTIDERIFMGEVKMGGVRP